MASPSETVHSAGISGFTRRQPRVVETASRLPAGNARLGFGSTQGARVMDSTPPVSTMSASPVSIIREPVMAASSEEPHSRFIVVPGTETGKPGQQAGHPRDVAVVLAGAVGVAEDDLLDGTGVQLRVALQDRLQDHGGEVVGPDLGEAAVEPAERGADGVVHERAHASPSPSSSASTRWAIRKAVLASGTPQ